MKRGILAICFAFLLVLSMGFVSAESESVDLVKGWNMVSIYTFAELFEGPDSVLDELKEMDIEAVFFYNRYENEYIRLYPNPETEKLEDFLDMIGNLIEGENSQIGEYGGFVNSAMWVYSGRSQNLFFNTFDGPLEWENVGLRDGWNFLTFTREIIGKSLEEIQGTCEIESVVYWNVDQQDWEIIQGVSALDLDDIVPEDFLWRGFVVKVIGGCMMGNPDIIAPPELPGSGECTDEDGGLNFLVKGIVKIDNQIAGIDYCKNPGELVEYYCEGSGVGVENFDCDCVDGECERGSSGGVVIEEDIGPLVFSDLKTDDDCEILEDMNCELWVAEYYYPGEGVHGAAAFVEKHEDSFSNADFLALKEKIRENFGEVGEEGRGAESFIYGVTESGDEVNYLILWYNGNNVIGIIIEGWNIEILDDDIFEYLLDVYLEKYPSEVVFDDEALCSDSDVSLDFPRGKDYYVFGEACSNGDCSEDYCVDSEGGVQKSSGTYLFEAFCVEGSNNLMFYECPYGCLDGACKVGEDNYPQEAGSYSLYDSRTESGCEEIDQDDLEDIGLNISVGEICFENTRLQYRDSASNKVVFVNLMTLSKGIEFYEAYLDLYGSSVSINGYDIIRVEDYELVWFASGDSLILTQEGEREDHGSGTSYHYGTATGDNPVTEWFLDKYTPISV